MSTIRAAILGYGRNGSTMHAGGVDSVDGMEVVAVCDIDPERRKQAEERYHCAVYEDYHAMLEKEQLDVVIIVTLSSQHCQMTCDCLKAGVNVLVTKPWAVNEGEARQMIDTWKASDAMLLPWLPSRWGCDMRRLRQLIQEGAIGDVHRVRRIVTFYATRNDWQMWAEHGGGYILNWGPHILDTAVQVLGQPIASVYAWRDLIINPGDTEDVFTAAMRTDTGALITAEHDLSAVGMPNWMVHGTRGTLVMTGNHLTIHRGEPRRPDDPTRDADMKSPVETVDEDVPGHIYGDTAEIYQEIAAALRGEQPYPVTPEDALGVTRILDAIKQSADTNQVVSL
jgi:predicted dehydrogenase